MIDIAQVRRDFKILNEKINGKPLIYFDNAATSQKPQVVVDALLNYYQQINSNVHRGVHSLAEKATNAFEKTRETVRGFINAKFTEEIIFTKGTTEGINLVARSLSKISLEKGDEVIVSAMEHHANIVPWQMVCDEVGAKLKVIPITLKGELDLDSFESLITPKTKIVAVIHVSNVLGTVNDIKGITKTAHKHNALVLVDGAQGIPHLDVDVQDLDCDFYAFSAHKVYGPTGIGVLYGKKELLEKMPPFLGGGEMISEVTFEKTTYNELPYKFEAGTPNIGDVIAFDSAVNYLKQKKEENIVAHENELLEYATKKLKEIEGIKIVGESDNKISVISFIVEGIHSFDLGMMLDAQGIEIRTGHHCAQPLMRALGIEGTARVSFAIYNTKEEVDIFVEELKRIVGKFARKK